MLAAILLAAVLLQAPRGWLLVPREGAVAGGRYAVDCSVHWLGFLFGDAAVRAGGRLAPGTLALLSGERRAAARVLRRLRHAPRTADAAAALVARAAARVLPDSLSAFAAASGYREWSSELLSPSRAKHLPRRIYRNPGRQWRMSVAETLNPDGSVRETEIVRRRAPTSTAVDFFVYDDAGRLAASADFGTARQPAALPAPAICARCHYDPASGRPAREPVFLTAGR
ncbi:MAG: hypothetical protein RKL32_15840 [Gammaproteobacteria bacterium]